MKDNQDNLFQLPRNSTREREANWKRSSKPLEIRKDHGGQKTKSGEKCCPNSSRNCSPTLYCENCCPTNYENTSCTICLKLFPIDVQCRLRDLLKEDNEDPPPIVPHCSSDPLPYILLWIFIHDGIYKSWTVKIGFKERNAQKANVILYTHNRMEGKVNLRIYSCCGNIPDSLGAVLIYPYVF